MKKISIETLKEKGNRVIIEDEVIRMAKNINQRFYRLEKQNIQNNSYIYVQTAKEMEREKPRYLITRNKIKKESIENLYKTYLDLRYKTGYSSSYTSKVKRSINARIESLTQTANKIMQEAYEEGRIKTRIKVDASKIREFFEKGGGMFLKNKKIDSEQIIEDFLEATQGGKITTDEFLAALKEADDKELTFIEYKQIINRLKKRAEENARG